jgi:hypothetical protein
MYNAMANVSTMAEIFYINVKKWPAAMKKMKEIIMKANENMKNNRKC